MKIFVENAIPAKIRGLYFFNATMSTRSIDSKRNGGKNINNRLQEIERKSDGTLYQMTPKQFKAAKKLIRESCCHYDYDSGNCLLLDDGETCVCPQSISYSVCCKWFRKAVMPYDKALEAGIFRMDTLKRCSVCGQHFASKSNRAKYCENCSVKVHRKQKAESERKRRWKKDK